MDLEEHAAYLAKHGGLALGHRFLLAAHETFIFLSHNPKIGWHPRFRVPELKTARIFSVSGFEKMLVFYRPTNQGIEVLRVIHGTRNILSLFRREGPE